MFGKNAKSELKLTESRENMAGRSERHDRRSVRCPADRQLTACRFWLRGGKLLHRELTRRGQGSHCAVGLTFVNVPDDSGRPIDLQFGRRYGNAFGKETP